MATNAGFLEGLSAVDLGIWLKGEDFAATTDMTETLNQTVTYGDAFGTDGPVLRTVRIADENQITFTATLLKSIGTNPPATTMNSAYALKGMRDFEVLIKRGGATAIYTNCNWTSIVITSGVDSVTLAGTISVPGYTSLQNFGETVAS